MDVYKLWVPYALRQRFGTRVVLESLRSALSGDPDPYGLLMLDQTLSGAGGLTLEAAREAWQQDRLVLSYAG